METHAAIARALAAAFTAGSFEVDELVDRGSRMLGRRWRWLRPLARRVAENFAGRTRPRQRTLTEFIRADREFARACERHGLRVASLFPVASAMCPVDAAKSWGLPSFRTAGELADWLGVSMAELDWFADLRGLEAKRNDGRLRHYHYRLVAKRFGQARLIEAPKPRLKEIQRRVLTEILDHIPPHSAAHGFRRGRSIRTFAEPHAGKRIVLKMDLQDFFPSISGARVQAIFRTAGYPECAADLLAGLCTNSTPPDAWDDGDYSSPQMDHARRLFGRTHLPQGAPPSPALANLCAYRMDCRLSGLAASAGAVYTRYADDLAFSGDDGFERSAYRFHLHASAIVMEEGFAVHHRKTRVMRQGVRQRLTGLVVNERLNVPRDDFDRLKAILTNCIRLGPQSQNRAGHADFRAHLEGRVSFVEMVNPTRGRRLRELLDRISW